MSANTVYPAASRRGASQSTKSSSSGVALLMNTNSRALQPPPLPIYPLGRVAHFVPSVFVADHSRPLSFRLLKNLEGSPKPHLANSLGRQIILHRSEDR